MRLPINVKNYREASVTIAFDASILFILGNKNPEAGGPTSGLGSS